MALGTAGLSQRSTRCRPTSHAPHVEHRRELGGVARADLEEEHRLAPVEAVVLARLALLRGVLARVAACPGGWR